MPGMESSSLIFLTTVVQVFLVNLSLSTDNAMVVALAASRFPGTWRRRAVFLGIVSAVLLQTALTFAATFLVRIPGLMLMGGVVLFLIACRLLIADDRPQDFESRPGKAAPIRQSSAIRMICGAYLLVSLDNILAVAVASRGDLGSMFIGLVASVLIVFLLSNLIAAVMDRLPWLVYVMAGIVAYTAAQMVILNHEAVLADLQRLVAGALARVGLPSTSQHIPEGTLVWLFEAAAILGCLGFGYARRRRRQLESALWQSNETAVGELNHHANDVAKPAPILATEALAEEAMV